MLFKLNFKTCGKTRRSADGEEARHSDIAVVTSPKITIYESAEVVVEEISELEPFIDGK